MFPTYVVIMANYRNFGAWNVMKRSSTQLTNTLAVQLGELSIAQAVKNIIKQGLRLLLAQRQNIPILIKSMLGR